MRAGSILVGQTINVANLNQMNNLVTALQNALALNGLLAGFRIQAVGVAASNGNTGTFVVPVIPTMSDDATRYRNIAIIVGTVIPVSLSKYLIYFSHYLRGLFHSL